MDNLVDTVKDNKRYQLFCLIKKIKEKKGHLLTKVRDFCMAMLVHISLRQQNSLQFGLGSFLLAAYSPDLAPSDY